jgi:CBS domain containing-hemolysin-like protein
MPLLILYFSLALGVSFLCSLLEAVILSVSRAYIESKVREGHKYGVMLKHLKKRINRPLSAILTLNTIANTVGAAGVGAQALHEFGSGAVAIVSAILTFCILVFSEIIPKTLGATYWRQLAPAAGYMINVLIIITYPLVLIFENISRWLAPKVAPVHFSREELMTVLELGKKEGALLSHEDRVIQNLLCLKDIRVKDILTPRSVMLAFSKEDTVGEVVEKYRPIRFSRIPVYGKDLDDITGIVHRHQLLQLYSQDQVEMALEGISKDIHAIPDSKSVASTLEEFIKRQEHIFLVVDEYGGTEGIVTLEDSIETLLGVEIVDEFDTAKDMRKLARELWDRRQKARELYFGSSE